MNYEELSMLMTEFNQPLIIDGREINPAAVRNIRTSCLIPRGSFVINNGSAFMPPCLIMNPEDYENLRSMIEEVNKMSLNEKVPKCC